MLLTRLLPLLLIWCHRTSGDPISYVQNDLCINAIRISLTNGYASKTGTTQNATIDSDVEDLCNHPKGVNAPGVWYKYAQSTGGGSTMRASTCNDETTLDTVVTVFQRATSGDCSSLTCLGQADDNYGGDCSVYRSIYDWYAEAGETYYILVSGFGDDEVGDFRLELYADLAPSNNFCEDAIDLDNEFIEDIAVVNATTEYALSEWEPVHRCFPQHSGGLAPAIWYSVTGTGSEMSASTCGRVTDFDTIVTIFEEGTGCHGLTCIGQDDDLDGGVRADSSCDQYESQIEWVSTLGTRYYILVHGFFRQYGHFELTVDRAPVSASG